MGRRKSEEVGVKSKGKRGGRDWRRKGGSESPLGRKDGAEYGVLRVVVGEGLVFLEISTRGPRRAKPQPLPPLGRAIIVRNGEIIPMSREFTPETERQRLQLLVSRNSTPDSCSSLSLVPVPGSRGLPHPHHTDRQLLSARSGRRVGLSWWKPQQEAAWAAPVLPLRPQLRKEVEAEVGREQHRPLRGSMVQSSKPWP